MENPFSTIDRIAVTVQTAHRTPHAPSPANAARIIGSSTSAVEGLNNKIRLVTKRPYGFRTYEAIGDSVGQPDY